MLATARPQNLTWEKSAGTGEIYSWTTVWRPQMPSFEVPYVAIIVDMDEGWQILSNLVGCEHDAVEIGMRVEVEFHEMEGGFTLPYFRPFPAADPCSRVWRRCASSISARESPVAYCARLLCRRGRRRGEGRTARR